MSRSPLAVPLAAAPDGTFVGPLGADPAVAYTCIGCGAPLVLRRSTSRRAHFAHRTGEGCSSESVLHRAAKTLVVQVVNRWCREGGPRPSIDRPCPVWSCDGGVIQDLPEGITGAGAEVRLADGSVADVVLYRGDEPACVVEILATHAVDEEKARSLALPWVELDAEDLLDRPYWWVAVQDGLRPFSCPRCAAVREARVQEIAEARGEAVRVAERSGQRLPPSPPYHAAPHHCWRCGARMVVFLWPGAGTHSGRTPPPPRPDTVRLCATEGYGGPYWANCCPSCGAVQGDGYLRNGNQAYARLWSLLAEAPGEIGGW